jgi:hypothetical protein
MEHPQSVTLGDASDGVGKGPSVALDDATLRPHVDEEETKIIASVQAMLEDDEPKPQSKHGYEFLGIRHSRLPIPIPKSPSLLPGYVRPLTPPPQEYENILYLPPGMRFVAEEHKCRLCNKILTRRPLWKGSCQCDCDMPIIIAKQKDCDEQKVLVCEACGMVMFMLKDVLYTTVI